MRFLKLKQAKHTLPMNEEALVQLVPNIDSNVVVCGNIDSRTWELVVDGNDLQQKQCRRDMRAITKNPVLVLV